MRTLFRIQRGLAVAGLSWAVVAATVPGAQGGQIVSQFAPGTSGAISNVAGGDCYEAMATPDGRFVLFASTANNLVVGTNGGPLPDFTPDHMNVFLRDRQLRTTALVSFNSGGTAGGNGDSYPDAISSNGRFVLFESDASNLVAGDTNNTTDIFLRDMVNGTTTLISATAGGSPGNGKSQEGAMTPDGRYIAFSSLASNLVAGDTNGISDIFVFDTQLQTMTLASPGALPVSATNTTPLTAGASSDWPVLSSDGRYVAFYSTATNLVTGGPIYGEVYVRDLVSNVTIWVSSNAHTVVKLPASPVSANLAMSTNGQIIAYQSSVGSTNGIVFQYNVATGLTETIMTNGPVINGGETWSRNLDISADGRFVAFTTTNTVRGSAVELWDSSSNTLTLVSGTNTSADSEFPRLDATGRYVLFLDNDATLTPNSDGFYHGYLRDTLGNTVQLIDVGTTGTAPISEITDPPFLSGTGNLAAFACFDGANSISSNKSDAFARDLVAGATQCVSTPTPLLPAVTGYGISGITSFASSSNGQYVAFYSDAAGLTPNATNAARNIFVHNFSTGANVLENVGADGVTPGNLSSFDPAISADGRYVAFSSVATNLVANDTNGLEDVFLRDTVSNTTQLVSVGAAGSGSYLLQLSTDGQKVLFYTMANYPLSPTNAGSYWRDMQAGTTYYIGTTNFGAMTPDGSNIFYSAGTNLYLWQATTKSPTLITTSSTAVLTLAVSPDATRGVYCYGVGATLNLAIYTVDILHHTSAQLSTISKTFQTSYAFSGDSQSLAYLDADASGTNQLYLLNFSTGASNLVSQSYDSTGGANYNCDSPAVSQDGRFVAYRSAASNLVPGDAGGLPNIFLYDSLTGGTTLVTASEFGNFAGNSRSQGPCFSPDGRTLLFESWSSDLAAGDFNQFRDVFALSLSLDGVGGLTNGAAPQITGILLPLVGGQFVTGQPVTLTWSATAGAGYQVQFTDDLSDPQWQVLDGPATIVGAQGQILDPAPGASQRFYRVVSY